MIRFITRELARGRLIYELQLLTTHKKNPPIKNLLMGLMFIIINYSNNRSNDLLIYLPTFLLS